MSSQELLAAGNAAFNSGDVDRAIAVLGTVSADDPQIYGQALLLMGRSYLRKKQFDQARLCLEESYNVRKHARTLFHLGECLYQSGDRHAAEQCLEAATQADETLTDAWIMLGVVRKEQGRPKDALPCFDRAVKNDPKAVVARFQIAQVTYELGDMQRAATQAHHVLQHADDFVPAHLLMANITLKLGDYRQAAVEFCRVLELSGPDAMVYMSLGRAFAHLQDYPQAVSAFEAAFELEPDNEMACSAVARLAERQGDTQKAGDYFRRLLRFEGSKDMAAEALNRLGLPADAPPPPAPAKKPKKGKGKAEEAQAPAARPKGPAVRFQPPKSIDKAGLPSTVPTRSTGRLIGEKTAAPARPQAQAPAPRVSASPTTPLDNMLDGLEKILDRTPLKGSFDKSAVGKMANSMLSKVNQVTGNLTDNVNRVTGNLTDNVNRFKGDTAAGMVDRLKSGIISKVKREQAEPAAPQKPAPPATGSLKRPPAGGTGPTTGKLPNRPKPKS